MSALYSPKYRGPYLPFIRHSSGIREFEPFSLFSIKVALLSQICNRHSNNSPNVKNVVVSFVCDKGVADSQPINVFSDLGRYIKE